MKRKGLSWDGGKKRIIAIAMLLSVLAVPGVAQAETAATTTDQSVAGADLAVQPTIVVRGARLFGVSWS